MGLYWVCFILFFVVVVVLLPSLNLVQRIAALHISINAMAFFVQIVDFCCGSNDFSCLMKEELDRMGKICQFRNFDLIQPKVNNHHISFLHEL